MKSKKPSLLDMENFVQNRADQKTSKNSSKKAAKGKAASKSKDQAVSQTDLLEAMKYMLTEIAPKGREAPVGLEVTIEEQAMSIDALKNEISQLKMDFLKMVSDHQKGTMELQNELARVKEGGIETARSFVDVKSSVQDLKMRIDKIGATEPVEEKVKAVAMPSGPVSNVDENYKTLIYRNVVMLMDEKDFSPFDVTRLFKLEGFAVFQPYMEWNERTVMMIYEDARKAGFVKPIEKKQKSKSANDGFVPGEIPPELVLPKV